MSKTNTVVIYHKSDFDGIFCREIARKFLPDAELIGWEYGEPTPEVPASATLYIMDLSVPDLMNHPGLVWIDHHKTAIERYSPEIPGYRIDGVAACRASRTWTCPSSPANTAAADTSRRVGSSAANCRSCHISNKERQENPSWLFRYARRSGASLQRKRTKIFWRARITEHNRTSKSERDCTVTIVMQLTWILPIVVMAFVTWKLLKMY